MEENTLKIEIRPNEDGTHSLVVTGNPEDVATVAAFLTLSIAASEEAVESEDDLIGG